MRHVLQGALFARNFNLVKSSSWVQAWSNFAPRQEFGLAFSKPEQLYTTETRWLEPVFVSAKLRLMGC